MGSNSLASAQDHTLRLDVFFRSCGRVHAVHEKPRVVSAPKSEIARRCLATLVTSLRRAGGDVRLTIVDDHSSAAHLAMLAEVATQGGTTARIVSLDVTGNGPSMLATFEIARRDGRELVYIVEDDYLHAPSAMAEMQDAMPRFTAALGRSVVLFPCDYPDRYRDPYPSYVFLGAARHWRSVLHTTATFLLPHAVLVEHWRRYAALGRYGADRSVTEDTTINAIYREVPCLAPLPSLAVHLAEPDLISPFVAWRDWWEHA